jgi:hypothetical protein
VARMDEDEFQRRLKELRDRALPLLHEWEQEAKALRDHLSEERQARELGFTDKVRMAVESRGSDDPQAARGQDAVIEARREKSRLDEMTYNMSALAGTFSRAFNRLSQT